MDTPSSPSAHPIPPSPPTATYPSLYQRLLDLQSNLKRTLPLISRLQNLPSPAGLSSQDYATPTSAQAQRAGDGPEGDWSFASDDVRIELAGEIHAKLKEVEEALEILRIEAEDEGGEADHDGASHGLIAEGLSLAAAGGWKWMGGHDTKKQHPGKDRESEEKGRVQILVKLLEEDLKSARTSFRKAQITAKRTAEASRRRERQLLFSSTTSDSLDQSLPRPPPRRTTTTTSTRARSKSRSRFTPGDLLTTASNDITHALRRTHNLLVNELSRSQFASDTLAQSSAALQSLGSSYTDLDSMLSTTKTLLGGLLRSQKSDTWYLETTVYLLVGTIAWLVFRRLLWGPAWWLVWMPLKITYKGAGGGVGLVRRLSSGGEGGLAEVGYGGGQGEGVFMDAGVPIAAPAWPAEPALGEVEREGNKGAMEHIERIATSVPGEGAQTQVSGAETTHTEAGYAIPVDNVPGGPGEADQATGQDGEKGPKEHGTTLPDPEDDKDLPRNPKKRMHEEDIHAPVRDEL